MVGLNAHEYWLVYLSEGCLSPRGRCLRASIEKADRISRYRKIKMGFEKLDRLKEQLDALRPLPEHTVRSLHEQMVIEWTYNSNAIEGNTLTLKETKVVLEGITIGGKSLPEHLEAINHKDAIAYVESIIAQDEPFGERLIKSIHQLVLKGIDSDNAGVYRDQNVVISGAEHVPPDHLHLDEQMGALVEWYRSSDLHPVECAARLHTDFVKIHPFVDGNGRTARLLMNFELLRSGYLPVVIQVADRLAYYEALDTAHTKGDYSTFIKMVINAEMAVIERHLRLITGS